MDNEQKWVAIIIFVVFQLIIDAWAIYSYQANAVNYIEETRKIEEAVQLQTIAIDNINKMNLIQDSTLTEHLQAIKAITQYLNIFYGDGKHVHSPGTVNY